MPPCAAWCWPGSVVASTALAELLSRKSVPVFRVDRPSPASLKVTPAIASFEAPVSSKVRLRVSPFKRLMPLNEESCAVVLIFCRTWLYCATRLARVACEFGSATGAAARQAAESCVAVLPVSAPIVDEAALLVVVMLICAGRVDAGLQVIRRQRRIELVEGRDLAGAGAERDVGCRAAAGGGDLQRLDR